MSWVNLLTKKTIIIALVLLSGLTWLNSITSEFSGYDDIALIVTKGKVHNGVMAAAKFYIKHPSISQNGAWSNQPNFIYRPLEWIGSALGYSLWGANAVYFHIFFNYLFHLLNTLVVFFILLRIFQNNIILAGASSAIWTVHPLHNEAINMLTSGVGFLFATFFALSAFLISMQAKDYSKVRDWFLVIWSIISFIIAYLGSEMAIIAAPCLTLYYLYEKQTFQQAIDWIRVLAAWLSVFLYFQLRGSVLSESHAWTAGFSEIYERVFVLAPEIFFHYLKLYFYPAVLTVDQHHQVILSDPFSLYHLLCLTVSILFLAAIGYFAFKREYLIACSLIMTILSLGIVLNIIPLYVLARERYCYIFTLALTVAIVALVNKYYKNKVITIVFLIVVLSLSARSIIRNQDWQNGEKLWTATLKHSSHDLGLQQLWRAPLLDYYSHHGTETFKPDPKKWIQVRKEFDEFITVNKLDKLATLKRVQEQAKKNRILDKYGYTGAKTIASGLYVLGKKFTFTNDTENAFKVFKLGHYYYPEHFQINESMVTMLGAKHPAVAELFDLMDKEALHNPYLARQLVKLAFLVNSSKFHEYAEKYAALNPNMLDLQVQYFNSLYLSKRLYEAYILAKKIQPKYKENDSINNFIRSYELSRYGISS